MEDNNVVKYRDREWPDVREILGLDNSVSKNIRGVMDRFTKYMSLRTYLQIVYLFTPKFLLKKSHKFCVTYQRLKDLTR